MKNYTLDQLLGGLRSTESSGRYDAMGPITKTGDRAYGAYQVMGANVPNWTKEVLGNAMTPQQFLSDQKAQDAVARAKFGGYLQNGTAQDAISMWFSGRPLAQAGQASDGYMKTPDYVNKVLSYAENQQPSGPPGMVASDAQPQEQLQEQTLVPGTQQEDRYSGVGPALANLGSIVAGLDRGDNRGLVAGLANTADNLVAQQRINQQSNGWDVEGFNQDRTAALMRNKQTGEIKMTPMPAGFSRPEQTQMEKDLAAAQRNPALMAAYNSKYDIDTTQADSDSLKMAGMDWLMNGNPQALKDVPIKQRNEAMRLAREQYKKDTGDDFDPTDLAVRRGDYKMLQSESSKFGQMLAPTQAAHDRLQADIKIAKERIVDIPSELNTHNMPWNKFMQYSAEQLQTQGYDKLAKAREAIYNVERGYTNVQANGMRTGDTVAAQKRAEALINSAMTPDTLLGEVGKDGQRRGGLLDFMSDSGSRILNSVKGGQDTLRQEWKSRARNFGSGVQKTEDDIVSDIEKRTSGASTPTHSGTAITREAYDKLPSGSKYIDPNGVERIKK